MILTNVVVVLRQHAELQERDAKLLSDFVLEGCERAGVVPRARKREEQVLDAELE